ncbi:MAG: anti-sigma factor [Bacteroidetes bacterium]|nr:anti-sigma factor [Bacteroidota bacterium]
MNGEPRRRFRHSWWIAFAVVLIVLAATLTGRRTFTGLPSDSALVQSFDPAMDTAFFPVLLKGTLNDTAARALVYWNPAEGELYLNASNVRQPDAGFQLELWALVDGQFASIGTFDPPLQELKKMKTSPYAAAFAITIEPAGGREVPSLETMQVIGSVTGKRK